jgi:outer membrane receptor protein involved in Fe transport
MKATRMLGSLSWVQNKGGKRPYRLQILGNYDYGRDRFDDQQAEIGLGAPQLTDDRNHSLLGRVASSVTLMPWLELTSVAAARYLLREPEDELAAYEEQPSDRVTVSGSIEPRFFGVLGKVALELRPSVLLSWSRASIESPRPDIQAPGESSDFLPTYRVGAAMAPLSWLGFRGSVSSGFRLPDRLQLFGNRGTVLPNPSLRPERSLEFDAAVTARGHRGLFSGYVSAGWFSRHIEDQIRFRRTAQFTVVAENIDSGRTRGAELELRASISCYFMLDGELTWIDAIDESTGNEIPGQPSWLALARPAVHSGPLRTHLTDLFAFLEVNYVGDSFADPANLVGIQSRSVLSLGLGTELFEGALGLGFRVDDLLDVRGEDLLGFPLPGLRFSGRVSYQHAW